MRFDGRGPYGCRVVTKVPAGISLVCEPSSCSNWGNEEDERAGIMGRGNVCTPEHVITSRQVNHGTLISALRLRPDPSIEQIKLLYGTLL
jgi:hypothetical protein